MSMPRSRKVLLERRGGEVLVDVPRPSKNFCIVSKPYWSESGRMPTMKTRSTAADPVPERERVIGVDAKLRRV